MRLPLRLGIALAVVGAFALVPGVSRAERAAVFVGGDDVQRAARVKAVQDVLLANGWESVVPKASVGEVVELVECVLARKTSTCIPPYAQEAGADRTVLIALSVEGTNKEPTIVITGWIHRATGDQLASSRVMCERCRDEALRDELRKLVVTLLEEAKSRTRPSALEVRSMPPGARVWIDGKEAGLTDDTFPVTDGLHMIELELKGYRRARQTANVGVGETMEVVVPLQPARAGEGDGGASGDGARPGEGASSGSRVAKGGGGGAGIAPWLVLGGGAALALGGGVLLALDESNVQDGRWVRHRETTVPGAVALGVGGAALVAGLVWLLAGGDGEAADVAPTVSLGVGGAHVGMVGRF